MKDKTFKALYEEEKKKPTAAQQFITDVAALTMKSESTVRMWITGVQVPDQLTQSIIAGKYDVSVDSLFPKTIEQ